MASLPQFLTQSLKPGVKRVLNQSLTYMLMANLDNLHNSLNHLTYPNLTFSDTYSLDIMSKKTIPSFPDIPPNNVIDHVLAPDRSHHTLQSSSRVQ